MRGISRKRISLILIIYAVIFSFIGGSLAYLNWESNESQNTEIVFTLNGDFSCSADVGGSINPEDIPLAPSSCTNSTHAIKRELIIKPTIYTDKYVYMDLWLDINSIAEELSASENFKYALTTSDNSCTDDVIVEGTFNQKIDGDKINLFYQKQYTETTEETYYLYIWLDAAETNINTAGKSFDFTINGTCSDLQPEHTVTFDGNGGVIDSTLYTTVDETEYTVPSDGEYQLEVWGAQGGSTSSYRGGYGGYSIGEITLTSGTTLYVNVGGSGTANLKTGSLGYITGGYNGGGTGTYAGDGDTYSATGGSGGGATHIATKTGTLSELSNEQSSILIVGGGGGGSGVDSYESYIYSYYGGDAGGYQGNVVTGENTTCIAGTQVSGNLFGQGGNYASATHGAAGGGGGWYGGGGGGVNAPGCGGSSYIGNSLLTNKAMYCYNCTTSSDATTLTYSTTNVSSTPTANYAKSGNGAAKITQLTGTKLVTNSEKYGALPTPTRSGYTFVSWNTSSDGTGETITSEAIVNLDSNQTLYAIWKPNTYTIEYIGNGGTWNNTNKWTNTATYGEKYTIEEPFYTRSGYTQTGWTTKSDGTNDGYGWTDWSGTWVYDNGNYGISDNKLTLYAVWKTNTIYLYNAGNEYTDITGGWRSRGWAAHGDISYSAYGPQLTKNSTYMSAWLYWHNLGGAVYVSGAVDMAKDFDFTNVSTLYLDYSAEGESMIIDFLIGNRNSTYAHSGAVRMSEINVFSSYSYQSRRTVSLDVSSLTGSYDIAILMYSNWQADGNATVNIYSVYAK